MKTWTLKVNEDELKALILHHNGVIFHTPFDEKVKAETSARLHDLVKRLHKDTPEIEGDSKPEETTQQPTAAPKSDWS